MFQTFDSTAWMISPWISKALEKKTIIKTLQQEPPKNAVFIMSSIQMTSKF